MKPRVFIGSSGEDLSFAYAVQENLERDLEVTVWNQGIFDPSKFVMESLLEILSGVDFGIFIFSPNDILIMREAEHRVARDNVVFELGLCVGKIGRERSFIILPRSNEALHLPTDLLGLLPATFDSGRQDGNLNAALGPACNAILRAINKIGLLSSAKAADDLSLKGAGLVDDPGDCISLIESWMGARQSTENSRAIRFDEVDQLLHLAPGSSRLYIEEAAKRWDYECARRGKDTILFSKIRPSSY